MTCDRTELILETVLHVLVFSGIVTLISRVKNFGVHDSYPGAGRYLPAAAARTADYPGSACSCMQSACAQRASCRCSAAAGACARYFAQYFLLQGKAAYFLLIGIYRK